MQNEFPTGVVTLVFTDIEGSSQLWEQHRDEFRPILDLHNRLIRAAALQWRGYEVKTQGDSFMLAFAHASDAVQCALEIQFSFAQQNWPADEVLVRIGMHTGEPFVEVDAAGHADYFGPVVNRAARISSAGYGGQILLSQRAAELAAGVLASAQNFDRGFHRLRGLEETEHIFEVQHAQLPARQFPALKTLSARQVRLPDFPTPFLGRDDDIAKLGVLLRDDCTRLLLVLGPGGVGKTRLCARAAEEVAENFSDGVRFIELETARMRSDFFLHLANHFEIVQQAGKSEEQCVLDFLSGKNLLLVLDNAEQIEELPGALDAVLVAAPEAKCVLPSREKLNMSRARVYEVAPLSEKESASFFAERARAHAPDFEITPENEAAIAGLCRRLEGVPLALELAAAWAADLSPSEILEEIEQQLDVLSVEASDVPERQRAIRSSIDWSFMRLEENEQRTLVLLSVFAGGFSREAAAAVCGLNRMQAISLLRCFGAKSLLTKREVRGQTRFGMLYTIHRYLREKLQSHENASSAHENHARFFLEFAHAKMRQLRTPGEATALRDMEDDVDNLRAALEWSSAQNQHQLAAEIALELGQFLERRGFLKISLRCVEKGLDAVAHLSPGEATFKKLRAELLRERASSYLDRQEWDKASHFAREALALFEECVDETGMACSCNLLGVAACRAKDFKAAFAHFEEAETAFQRAGDISGQAIVWHNQGLTATENGDLKSATEFLERALQTRREIGDRRGLAETLNNLGVVAQEQNEWDKAWSHYLSSLEAERELQDAFGAGRALFNLGEIAELKNQLQRAARLFAAAQQLFEEVGSPYKSYAQEACERVAPELASANATDLKTKDLAALCDWALEKEFAKG
jgi:predicted ATPase/class 3 adenylate cyclase